MTIPVHWFARSGEGWREVRDGKAVGAAPVDPALKLLVDRGDERLLRDAGLMRDDVLGPSGIFWQEWTRRLRHPML